MLKTIYRTHKERVQTTRSQPELPLFKLIKCARDLWPFGNREDAASRKSRRRCLEDSTARKQQLFWSVQSSPVQSSPQSSLVQSPGFTETRKLVMELRVQYSLVQMNGETQLYIMQQMRSNLYKWRAEHNAKFICFAKLVQMRGAGIQYNNYVKPGSYYFHACDPKTCLFCKTMMYSSQNIFIKYFTIITSA